MVSVINAYRTAQDINRTEGDGTDSPATASPFYDQRSKDRFSGPPQYGRNISPAGRSPSANRAQSLIARGPDPRSPEMDGRWPGQPPMSYNNDWQVRDYPYDQRDGSYLAERPYTPPMQQYTNDYDHQSPLGQHPAAPGQHPAAPGQHPAAPGHHQPFSRNVSNANYDHYNSNHYPQSHVLEQRNSQPYVDPNSSYAREEYGTDPSSVHYMQDREPVRGHSILMAGQEHEQAYRGSGSAAYNTSYNASQYEHEEEYQHYDRVMYLLATILLLLTNNAAYFTLRWLLSLNA